MPIAAMSELESSLISFAASDSFSAMFVIQVVNFELEREGITKEKMARGVGRVFKRDNYFQHFRQRGAIIRVGLIN